MNETASWKILANRANERADRLQAEVKRLETERDGFRDRGVAVLEAQAEETAKALRDLMQAEKERDEAVARLRQTRDWSVAIRALDSWHEHGQAKCDCPGHKRIEKLRKILKKMEDTFLVGLSTDTGDGECAVRQPERSIRGSNGELC